MNDYLLDFDEIHKMTAISYAQIENEDVSEQTKRVTEDVLSLLISAYRKGIQAAESMLNCELTVDSDKMYDTIYKEIDEKDFEDRIVIYMMERDLWALQRLTESECHRVFNTAADDGAKEYAHETNARVMKTWNTMMDERVRETHTYLESDTIPLDREFYTYDGDHARFPGGFEKAENNVKCRCYLTYTVNGADSEGTR